MTVPFCFLQQSGNDLHKCCLAGAIWSQKAEHTLVDGQIHMFQSLLFSISFTQIFNHYLRIHIISPISFLLV